MSDRRRPGRSPLAPVDPVGLLRGLRPFALRNGLQVRLVPNRKAPICSLLTTYKVGSRNERPGETGLSHFVEHLMFSGSKRGAGKSFALRIAAEGGETNAYTTHDVCMFSADVPSEAVETVLELEADRMRALDITPAAVSRERAAVLAEKRLKTTPVVAAHDELHALAYGARSYSWPVLGWADDISAYSRESSLRHIRTYYRPNNAVLFLCGDFDVEHIEACIRRLYGRLEPGPSLEPVRGPGTLQRGERRTSLKAADQAPWLLLGWVGPPARSPDALVFEVLGLALGGPSGRLGQRLIQTRALAQTCEVDWPWRLDGGLFSILIEVGPEAACAEVEAIVHQELARIAADGLTETELRIAKSRVAISQYETLATNSGRAFSFAQYELLIGSLRSGLTLPSRYASVTSEDVKRCVRAYLPAERRNVVTLAPEGSAA